VREALEAEARHVVAARWTEARSCSATTARLRLLRQARRRRDAHARNAASLWKVVSAIGVTTLLRVQLPLDASRDRRLAGGRRRAQSRPARSRRGARGRRDRLLASDRRGTGAAPHARLRMKAPGAGVLEFEIEEVKPDERRISVTAYWHPRACGARLLVRDVPAHLVLFDALVKEIARRAMQRSRI